MKAWKLLKCAALASCLVSVPLLADEYTEPSAPKTNPFAPPAIVAKAPQQSASPTQKLPADQAKVLQALTYVGAINGNEVFSFNGQCYVVVQDGRLLEDQCYRAVVRFLHNAPDKP